MTVNLENAEERFVETLNNGKPYKASFNFRTSTHTYEQVGAYNKRCGLTQGLYFNRLLALLSLFDYNLDDLENFVLKGGHQHD